MGTHQTEGSEGRDRVLPNKELMSNKELIVKLDQRRVLPRKKLHSNHLVVSKRGMGGLFTKLYTTTHPALMRKSS